MINDQKIYPSISGFYRHQAKRVCSFFFGSFFSRIDVDGINKVFNIRIHKTIKVAIQYEIKNEILARILELAKQGKPQEEIKATVEKENSFTDKANVEDFLDIKDFKDYWGPQWKLIYESKDVA